jgi:hypothetical protein
MCVGGGWMEEMSWGNIVDALHIHVWNRMMECLAVALSVGGEGIVGGKMVGAI